MRRLLLLSAFLLPCAALAQATVATTASGSATGPGSTAEKVSARVAPIAPMAATAVRAGASPVLDGRGDDAVWATAPEITSFRQFEPNEDGNPTYETTAKVAFDDRNLFVLIHAKDPHPDSIVAQLTRRDEGSPSDWLMLLIDSYNDKRTGFEFHVNAAGVKRDYSIVNDGDEDRSWDAVWDVATAIVSDGWTPSSAFRSASSASRLTVRRRSG